MATRCISERMVSFSGRLGFYPHPITRRVVTRRLVHFRVYGSHGDGGQNVEKNMGEGMSKEIVRGDLTRLGSGASDGEQPSAELLELVKVQLDMLVSMLELRIRDAFEQMDMGVRCAMYCRTPSSITRRTLKFQLVATSDDRWDAPDNSTVFANEFIIGDDISADAEEAWVVNQPMIVLPNNGGLILPLTHKSFLVGLLLVERTLPNFNNVILPPVHDVFGPAEIGIIKQSGVALSMSCAMDLRAVMERAGARMQQERLQGLLSQASKPLSTLKTLGRMLQPRLSQGDLAPERDMTDSMVMQGQYLGDLLSQIQSVINVTDNGGSQVSPEKSRGGDQRNEKQTDERTQEAVHRKKVNVMGTSYPALPSSSIGADNWDTLTPSSSDDDQDGEFMAGDIEQKSSKDGIESSSISSRVSQIIRPLFDAALHFSTIKGFVFTVDDQDGVLDGDLELLAPFSSAKHIYGTLVDGAISSVNNGDSIGIQIETLPWKDEPGIFMAILLSQADGSHPGTLQDLSLQFGIEVEALVDDVDDLDGWLQFHDDVSNPANTLAHDGKSVLCSLWLPLSTSTRIE